MVSLKEIENLDTDTKTNRGKTMERWAEVGLTTVNNAAMYAVVNAPLQTMFFKFWG